MPARRWGVDKGTNVPRPVTVPLLIERYCIKTHFNKLLGIKPTVRMLEAEAGSLIEICCGGCGAVN